MAFTNDPALMSNQIPDSLDLPEVSEKDYNDILTIFLRNMATIVNTKEGAFYLLQEIANFQSYFTLGDPNTFRNVYRRTYDLVDLNGGPIPPGVTVINLVGDDLIDLILIPTHGYGAATIAGPVYLFYPGPDIGVRFNNTVPTAQFIRIANNTAQNLDQCYFVIEYTKN